MFHYMFYYMSYYMSRTYLQTGRGSFHHTVVCEKNTPPEKKTREHIGFGNTKSQAGEQLLLLDGRARACAKGVSISQTPVMLQSV